MTDDFFLDVFQCTTYDELLQSTSYLQHETQKLNSQLDSICESQLPPLSHSLQRLDILGAALSTPQQNARLLKQMLSNASDVASRISQKARLLDTEQSRVQESLDYVIKTQELKSSIVGIYNATQVRDWESVANHIYSASKLPSKLVQGKFAEAMVPTEENPEIPLVELEKATESFGALCLREFESAAAARDAEKITRYFKLFPLIGKEKEGLDVYAKFVCSIIAGQSRQLMSSKVEGPLFFGMVISRLFENIATIVDQHSPIVERYYGGGKMQRVIERIQLEADTQGGIIIDTYFDDRNISRRLSDIKSYAFSFLVQSFMPTGLGMGMGIRAPSPAVNTDAGGISVQEIDTLLNESSLIIGRWSLYCKFLAVKWWLHDLNLIHQEDDSKITSATDLKLPPILMRSQLANKMNNRVSPAFESMATFFFRRSLEKAFQLDEAPILRNLPPEPSPTNPLISSAIDDVMYVLNAVLERSVSTGQSHLIRNVIGNLRRVLESDLVGMIQRKMRDETYPKSAGINTGSNQPIPPPEDKVNGFLILLNNLDVAIQYISRIVDTVIASCGDKKVLSVLPFGDEHEQVTLSLRGLCTSFELRVKELLVDGTQVIFAQVIKARLRLLLHETFKDASYLPQNISNDDVEDLQFQQQADLVRLRFSYGWDLLVFPIRKILTEKNYSRLLSVTCEHVSNILENKIWALSGEVNELGAIQLERDVAGVIGHVSQGKWYFLREKFVRVAQLVMAIGLDEQELNAGGIEWILTEEERKRALAIKTDDLI
ncbi:COG4 transport protein-domain-containing protein [Lipomyces japonicus]|uniref:COG4 transport protein-domain-containing protein n=1 Tax=Lipomyces japonicus TaxID=56871 RepID=UPI0034CE0266